MDMALPARARTLRDKPARIAIFGNFGGDNLGNEGTLEAMIGVLRRISPDGELVCICPGPESIRRTYGIPAHPILARRSAGSSLLGKIAARFADVALTLRTVRGFRLLVIPGTGILDDFGEPPYGMPFRLFLTCLVARMRGIRIAFVSVGAGPIVHPVSRWLMVSAAKMAHYCTFRDDISRDFMAGLGMDPDACPIYPDLAFHLPRPAEPEAPAGGPLRVGMGVMSYNGWRHGATDGERVYATYLEKAGKFVRWLLDRGHQVRLLTGEKSDDRAVAGLLDSLSPDRRLVEEGRLVVEPVHSLHDLMREIALTDVVVATRYHNVVCALKMARPTISLSYAKKNDALLAAMGLGAYHQHVEDFDCDLLIRQFEDLLAHREASAAELRRMNAVFDGRLDEQVSRLADIAAAEGRAASEAPVR